MEKVKVIELFAGVGSQAMALRNIKANYEILGISEIDKFAIKSYNAIHGETYNFGDITKIKQLPECDLLTYSFPCFTKEAKVLTEKGYKNINEIRAGEKVLTHKNRYKKVLKIFNNGIKDIVKINGMSIVDIKSTPNHKFFVKTKTNKFPSFFGTAGWKEAKDLTKNDYLGIAINQEEKIPKWNGSIKYGKKINELSSLFENKNFWWLIGKYVSSGYVRKRGGIVISVKRKEEQIFEKKISKLFNFAKVIKETSSSYYFHKSELQNFCKQFGNKKENKKLTETILNLPNKFLLSFLEGFYCITDFEKKAYKKHGKNLEIMIGIGQCIAKVFKQPYSINKMNNIALKEKCNYYQLSFKNYKGKTHRAFFEENHLWFPIKSIEKYGSEEVFDIEVEEDHSFTVQNIMVHNCQSISTAGKREGIKEGTESGLLLEVKRLLEISKKNNTLPKWLVMENVKNLVSKRFMPQFQDWLDFLSDLGYTTKWKILNAKDYGIPQNRERTFAVSYLGKENKFEFPKPIKLEKRMKDYLEKEPIDSKYYISRAFLRTISSMKNRNGYIRGKKFKPMLEEEADIASTIVTSSSSRPENNYIIQLGNIGNINQYGGNPQTGRVYSSEGISPTLSTMQGGNRQPKILESLPQNFDKNQYNLEIDPQINTKYGKSFKNLIDSGYIVRKITPRECWRLMGFSDEDFNKAKGVGISDTQLYKQAGNSIVVNVLEEIFKNIFKLKEEE